MTQEATKSMGLSTFKGRLAGPEIKARCTSMITQKTCTPLSTSLRASDLAPLRKICANISRWAEHSTVHLMPDLRPDVLFLRTPLASFRKQRCSGPSPRLPTVHQTRTHPLTSLRPILIANPIHQMTLATAAPILVGQSRAVNTGRVSPAADKMTVGRHLHPPSPSGLATPQTPMIAGPHRHEPPPRSLGDNDRCDDGRSGCGRIVASHPPPGGVVGAMTWSLGPLPDESYEREREHSPPRWESARRQDRD